MRQCGKCRGYGTVPGRIRRNGKVEEIVCTACGGLRLRPGRGRAMNAPDILTEMAEAYLAEGWDADLRADQDAGPLLSDAVAARMAEIEARS